ncbi:hypothetical protein [Eubacterium sp. 1001713B170207_170306_E7]|uniref:hypothetical protein n=1 Tax=Eubacterium sp. 1001713B170207_170306_E7 TaxID=2787097 RepID=UPI0018974C0D|nr:hypothetical protein [Eubacterium sp. 1001713B170207_170306_E7]
MKKKASLWISGITTVAMLAVAVGSFAAWDTLKGDVGNGLTVEAGKAVTLTVNDATKATNPLKLVPKNALKDTGTETDSLEVGTFTASLAGATDKPNLTLKTKVNTAGVYNEDTFSTANNVYKVYLKADSSGSATGDPIVVNGELTLSDTPATYHVFVEFLDNNDGIANADEEGLTRNVKVELETVNDTVS